MVKGLTDAQLIRRLQRLEAQLRLLSERAGVPFDDGSAGVSDEVARLARAGDRMQAAKLHAQQTGCDFVSAQRAVSDIA